jgi:hypothetical protein
MSLVLAFDGDNAVTGSELTAKGWNLPATLTKDQWIKAGEMLAKVEQSKQWWLGDWWNAGVEYGDGEAACEAVGVVYQTAADCGMVSAAFDFSRRREKLTFTHHREVCGLKSQEERDRFLDWCEEPVAEGGKPRSTRELRQAIRDYLDEQGWTEDERERRAQVEAGTAVVANQRGDEHLIQWAKFKGLAVKVDRQSKWGNPFEMGPDGTRDQVCDAYGVYFKLKKSLHKDIGELRGKVLLCWCHPERCHSHFLQRLVNEA